MRKLLFMILIGAAAGFCGASCAKKKIDAVILITMESVSAADLSANHSIYATGDTTPVEQGTVFAPAVPEDLDDLATLGVRFSNTFAPSGSAFASLVSIHTGKPPEESGVYCDLDRLNEAPTLAESLSLNGIHCGAFVARPSLTKGCGLERGFETYITKPRGARPGEGDAGSDARAWIELNRLLRPDQPIFCWIHLSMPRAPFEPRDEWLRRFSLVLEPGRASIAALQKFTKKEMIYSAPEREVVHAYHAAAILQDAAIIAHFLSAARKTLNNFENTKIIFAGTNGEELGARGPFGSRRTLRDATLHVPLYYFGPGTRALPRVSGSMIELQDLTKTIADALGCEPPHGSRGGDLLSLATDPNAKKRAVFSSWENRIFTVRTLRERLICNPAMETPGGWPPGPLEIQREELYELDHDPLELTNLSGKRLDRIEQLRGIAERERTSRQWRAPVVETDPDRVKLLMQEGIHSGDGHPATPIPAATSGSRM
ncbi:MAG: sulfatase [Planctomycetota bacterium]